MNCCGFDWLQMSALLLFPWVASEHHAHIVEGILVCGQTSMQGAGVWYSGTVLVPTPGSSTF